MQDRHAEQAEAEEQGPVRASHYRCPVGPSKGVQRREQAPGRARAIVRADTKPMSPGQLRPALHADHTKWLWRGKQIVRSGKQRRDSNACYGRRMPDFHLEAALGGRVAGVDEAGRGPLAGPVVAASVVFPRGVTDRLAGLLNDSKKLSVGQRELAFAALLASGSAEIGVGAASVGEILRLNILQAALLAMRRAVGRLPLPPDFALIDGNKAPLLTCPTRCVVGGDGVSLSIAAASIVAKMLRDRGMARLAARYPGYGWAENAGYGTAKHRAALWRLGVSPHHRAGFGTVREVLRP